MRVFVTGAAGFIGSGVVPDLIGHGHTVVGLARSDANEAALKAMGASVLRGSLEDLDSLRKGAAESDGVIHLAFVHDFAKFAENGQIDKRAIEAMGETLAGTNKPMVVTSGVGLLAPGRLSTEEDVARVGEAIPRVSESAAFAFAGRGVRVSAVRLPQVHGETGKAGFVGYLVQIAQQKGVSAYVGGVRFYAPVHIGDVVRTRSRLLHTGRQTMHIAVRMSAGDPRTGEFRDTSHALVIVAAIDADGDATDVRPWVPTTAEDIALDAHARALIGLRREVPRAPLHVH